MTAVRLASMLVLLVLGAAGLSSLADDDFCAIAPAGLPEATGWSPTWTWWPPGSGCEYAAGGGRTVTTTAGSVPGFLAVLGVALAVAGWALTRRPPARLVLAIVLAVAGAGAGSLLGGASLGLSFGLVIGGVAAYLMDGLRGAAAGMLAVFALGFLWLLGIG